MRTYFSRHK